MKHNKTISFPDPPRKNDAVFLHGAIAPKPFVHVYAQQSVEVIHGPSAKIDEEVYVDRCQEDGVKIIERRSGGGTVVLTPGMVVTVIVVERRLKEDIIDIFNHIHRAMVKVLEPYCTRKIELSGTSDLSMSDKKVLGSSLYLQKSPFYYYYQSVMMVENDIALIGKYLRHPPREPEYRKQRTHMDFCSTLHAQECVLGTYEVCTLIDAQLPQALQ